MQSKHLRYKMSHIDSKVSIVFDKAGLCTLKILSVTAANTFWLVANCYKGISATGMGSGFTLAFTKLSSFLTFSSNMNPVSSNIGFTVIHQFGASKRLKKVGYS